MKDLPKQYQVDAAKAWGRTVGLRRCAVGELSTGAEGTGLAGQLRKAFEDGLISAVLEFSLRQWKQL